MVVDHISGDIVFSHASRRSFLRFFFRMHLPELMISTWWLRCLACSSQCWEGWTLTLSVLFLVLGRSCLLTGGLFVTNQLTQGSTYSLCWSNLFFFGASATELPTRLLLHVSTQCRWRLAYMWTWKDDPIKPGWMLIGWDSGLCGVRFEDTVYFMTFILQQTWMDWSCFTTLSPLCARLTSGDFSLVESNR